MAVGIQKGLQRIGRKPGRIRAMRVFRDDTNLTASPDLWGRIRTALHDSRYLIVILSPIAARSEWVNQEIAYWLDRKGSDALMLVLAGGEVAWDHAGARFDPELCDAVPPALLQPGVFRGEPLIVDMSNDRPWDYRDNTFRDKVTSLAAPVHGLDRADLASEDLREQRKFKRWRAAAIMGLAGLTVASLMATGFAAVQRTTAIQQRNEAVALALAAQAGTVAETNPALSLALAAASTTVTDQPLDQAVSSLVQARRAFADRRWQPVSTPLTADDGPISSIAYSPNGALLATGGDGGTIWLWDPRTGRKVGELAGHSEPVSGVTFSKDGKRLASASDDGTVRLWDPKTRKQVGAPLAGGKALRDVTFSPDGTLVAATSENSKGGRLHLWNIRTREELALPKAVHSGAVNDLAFSPGGDFLVTAGSDSDLILWNANGGALGLFHAHQAPISDIEFASTGLFAAGSWDGSISLVGDVKVERLWGDGVKAPMRKDFTAAEVAAALVAREAINSISFNPDGSLLASGDWSGEIRLWEPKKGKRACTPMASLPVTLPKVLFSPDGKLLASVSSMGPIQMWDPTTCKPAGPSMGGESGPKGAVTFSPDSSQFAAVDAAGSVEIWDLAPGEPVGELVASHPGGAYEVGFSPDRTRLVSVGDEGSVLVLDRASKRRVGSGSPVHKGPVTAMAFGSPATGRLLTAGDDGTIRTWDLVSGNPLGEACDTRGGALKSIALSPSGAQFAAAGDDGKVFLGDTSTATIDGDPLLAFTDGVNDWEHTPIGTTRVFDSEGHSAAAPPPGVVFGVTQLQYSPDGSRLASGNNDGTVGLWDLSTRERLGTRTEDEAQVPVTAISFSPDSSMLVTGDARGRLWIRDAVDGSVRLGPLAALTKRVTALAFSPDGTQIVSAGDDGVIRRWDPRSGVEIGLPLRGHWSSILEVAFSPDGGILASAGRDGALRLWNAKTGVSLGALTSPGGDPVRSLAFSTDSTELATADSNGEVRLWDAWRAEPACRLAEGYVDQGQVASVSPVEVRASGCHW